MSLVLQVFATFFSESHPFVSFVLVLQRSLNYIAKVRPTGYSLD